MVKCSSASRAGPRRSAESDSAGGRGNWALEVKSNDPITVFNALFDALARRIYRVEATPSDRLAARGGIVQDYPQEWASPVDLFLMRLRAKSTGSKRPRLTGSLRERGRGDG
jgi:hypothetical protein